MYAAKIPYYTVDAYLRYEAQSPRRHEYYEGEIVAMSGASAAHNLIGLNLASTLRTHLRGTPCRAYMSDMKLRITEQEHFFYPDVMVSCETPASLRQCHFVEDARLVIEVLSPSTEARDKEYKRLAYQKVPGLQEYVLVAQDQRLVMCYRRLPDGWEYEAYGAREVVELRSVALALPMEVIYEDVPE